MASARHHTGKQSTRITTTDVTLLLTSQQSLGWEHYEVHEPEPHILLFK
jgi:cyclin-dependent kinase regulatory subunit CKS1